MLGTLAELHREPIQYDLRTLRRLVKDLQPDLLCAEIHPDDWQSGELSRLPPEYRETLVPLSRRTDIIIIPVSGMRERELFAPRGERLPGFRSLVVRLLNGQLWLMQRLANGPQAINSGLFGWMCDCVCRFTAWVGGPQVQQSWDQANQAIVKNVLGVVRRDPGRRVLVTVDCRRRHRLEQALRHLPEVELVDYRHL